MTISIQAVIRVSRFKIVTISTKRKISSATFETQRKIIKKLNPCSRNECAMRHEEDEVGNHNTRVPCGLAYPAGGRRVGRWVGSSCTRQSCGQAYLAGGSYSHSWLTSDLRTLFPDQGSVQWEFLPQRIKSNQSFVTRFRIFNYFFLIRKVCDF